VFAPGAPRRAREVAFSDSHEDVPESPQADPPPFVAADDREVTEAINPQVETDS
jgi:hypothetical protein